MNRMKIVGVLVCILLVATVTSPIVGSTIVSKTPSIEKISDGFADNLALDQEYPEVIVVTKNNDADTSSTLLEPTITIGIAGFEFTTIPFNLPPGSYRIVVSWSNDAVMGFFFTISDSEGKWLTCKGLIFNGVKIFADITVDRNFYAGSQRLMFVGVGTGVIQIDFQPQQ